MKWKLMVELEMNIDEEKIDTLEFSEDLDEDAKTAFKNETITLGEIKISLFDEDGNDITDADDKENFRNYIVEKLRMKA